jgi:membrane-associated phospholipid phosphatase
VRDREPTQRTTRDNPSWRERVEPVGRAWRPLVFGWALIFGVVTVAGLLLTGPLDGGRLVRWDLEVAQWFVDHRTSTLNVVAETGTWLAETIPVIVVLAIAIVVAWRVSTNVAAPAFLAIAVGGEKVIYLVASSIVGRDRPPVPTIGTTYATASFPSGHVASAVSLYGSIALLIALHRRKAVRYVLLTTVGLVTVVVAACRMYCGFHFLTDSIAGALVGAVWLTVVYHAVLLASERRPPDADTTSRVDGHDRVGDADEPERTEVLIRRSASSLHR